MSAMLRILLADGIAVEGINGKHNGIRDHSNRRLLFINVFAYYYDLFQNYRVDEE